MHSEISSTAEARKIETWGGIECGVVRIGDRWRNQLDDMRLDLGPAQLRQIAALGLRRLRFPLLWEAVCPQSPGNFSWRWHDERLARLREFGIKPIAGLVHHGSGPRYTDLLDPGFATLLARYAEEVARRYPWIDAYTPVNEPLTTARFSALYGHWYPHLASTATFLRALTNQCRATVLAMRAIRRVVPRAQLIQTEDLGKTYSTPALAYQADYENERRWLTFDLLHGRVDRQHPFWKTFCDHGIAEAELEFFLEDPVAPDIVGMNHYLTSERYLDSNVDGYPAAAVGGNGRDRYADVEAVRVPACALDVGPLARLRELWARYRTPIAITEVQHGCTREEQLRWLIAVYEAARTARDQGVDLRAVTAWSLFGAVDWNTLLRQKNGHYECGAFDARSTPPRATLLGKATRALAAEGRFEHPVLDVPGWWQRADRCYLVHRHPAPEQIATRTSPRRILVIGRTGTLGGAFARICEKRGLAHLLAGRDEIDIADADSVRAALASCKPWAVINAAGYVRVEAAEQERERCFRENTVGAKTLAAACAERAIPLLTFSSDLVFDGNLARAYVESDAPNPRCTYGRSKAHAERDVMNLWPRALVVRTSAFFGPWDLHNFVHGAVARMRAGLSFETADNVIVSPTYVPDLVHAALDLLLDGESGLWHLANRGAVSWYELAQTAAIQFKLDASLVRRRPRARPGSTALASERGALMPVLEDALHRYVHAQMQ